MSRAFLISAPMLSMAATAMAAPDQGPAKIDQQLRLEAAMDTVLAERMTPGPTQDGWNKGGVDIYRLVEAAPGGNAANYLLTVDKAGERSVTIVGARDLGNIVPKSWKALMRAGSSKELAGSDSLLVGGIDGPFHFAGWENHRRVGDAFCSAGNVGGELYEAPHQIAESKIPREMIPSLFQAMAKHIEKRPMCWRYDRDGDGFKRTYFLEDGRTLPRLNESEDRVTIVRAAPIEQLLAKPASQK